MTLSRPRPVLTSAGIAGVVTSLAGVLTFLGYDKASAHLSAETSTIASIAIGAIALGSHLLAGLHAQAKVTPKDSPQADDGTPLVRADTVSTVTVEQNTDAAAVGGMDPVPDVSTDPAPPTPTPGA